MLDRLRPFEQLRDALDGVGWVQESAPEELEVKRELWELLDRCAEAERDPRQLDLGHRALAVHRAPARAGTAASSATR